MSLIALGATAFAPAATATTVSVTLTESPSGARAEMDQDGAPRTLCSNSTACEHAVAAGRTAMLAAIDAGNDAGVCTETGCSLRHGKTVGASVYCWEYRGEASCKAAARAWGVRTPDLPTPPEGGELERVNKLIQSLLP